MTHVGLAGTASYLPERVMTAAEVAAASGIPEDVIVEKFGLRGKHVADEDEHVSDLSLRAAETLLRERNVDPASIDAVMYYGSTWKDYAVWQVSPLIAHRLGCTNALALEFDNVSHGTPMALRVARDLLRAEEELRTILIVAACRESYLLDYANERSRFMFNFGDGAVAGLLTSDSIENELLGCHAVTDGSLALQVKVPRGGSVHAHDGYGFLDVDDPAAMKVRLDATSLDNFVRAAEGALECSGAGLGDVDYLCGIHMKPSMHAALLSELGLEPAQAAYLDDTGHMSGVDPLLALDRAARQDKLADGDLVLLLAAGTGYTWAAGVIRWGRSESRPR
jgi:3-oxoacyl-[acyl-carrier-protein] synthase III